MRGRCCDKNNVSYKDYGGRGIRIYAEWIDDFSVFQKWALSNGYKDGLEIDRFPDNDGNYEPGNVRFVTHKVNMRNLRNSRFYTWKKETKTLAEWAEDSRCAVSYKTLWNRLKDGWDFAKALTTERRVLTDKAVSLK